MTVRDAAAAGAHLRAADAVLARLLEERLTRSAGSTYYFLTAGHCGKLAATWYTNPAPSTLIGLTISYSFPGNDYALVRYDNTSLSHPGGYTMADAFVGE